MDITISWIYWSTWLYPKPYILYATEKENKITIPYILYAIEKEINISIYTFSKKTTFFSEFMHTPAVMILRVCMNVIRRGKQYKLDSINSFYFHNECIH